MFDALGSTFGVALTRRAKLDRFFRGVEGRAFSIAISAVKDQDAALDIIQDSMLRHIEYYQDRAADDWPPLFYKILASQIANWGRRAQLMGRHDEIDEYNQPVHEHSPERHAAASQSLKLLQTALTRLSEREYQAFMLRLIEGYSTKQAAVALECSEGTVKTLLSRAKAKLDTLDVGDAP